MPVERVLRLPVPRCRSGIGRGSLQLTGEVISQTSQGASDEGGPVPPDQARAGHAAEEHRTFLFLHGLGSTRFGGKSAQLQRALSQELTSWWLLRYDLRAHGQSEGAMTDADFTLTNLVEDTAHILQQESLICGVNDRSGSAVLVGCSLGALVAAWTAALHPDRVRAVAMLSPSLGTLRRWLRPGLKPGTVVLESRYLPMPLSIGPGFLAEIEGTSMSDAELLMQLPAGLPVFCAHGDQDDIIDVDVVRRWMAQLPRETSELLVVPGGDHRLTDQAEGVYAAMMQFLREQGVL